MAKYKLCPRCELNYIPVDEEYCDVCKAELKLGPQLMFATLDEDDDASEKLCPVCKQNYIPVSEDMCESCMEKQRYDEEKDADVDIDTDEEWKKYLDEDDFDDFDDFEDEKPSKKTK